MALIRRNTAYSINDIVNTKFGIKLKCTTAGTTDTDPLILDGTSSITDGTVVWEIQEEQVGQGLVDYEANKNYNVGDIVIFDDKIYRCITAHTSTATFDDTKWEEISGGGGSGGYIFKSIDVESASQSNPYILTLFSSNTFTKPPTYVLKKVAGSSNQNIVLDALASTSSDNYTYNNTYVEIDNGIRELTEFNVNMSVLSMLGIGYISTSDEIDLSDFKNINEVVIL